MVQIRRFENLTHERSEVAQHHVTALAAKHASKSNQGANSAAVNEIHLLHIQNHLLRLEHEFVHFDLKDLQLIARDDATVASQHHDVSNSRVLYLELHHAPNVTDRVAILPQIRREPVDHAGIWRPI